jgi:hypothetical protein
MKKPERSTKAPMAQRTPLEPRQFPMHAQTEATAGRDKVREEAYPVRAPRQSERRVETSRKGRTGA